MPPTEDRRLRALHAFAVLDTPPEPGFDDAVLLAQAICDVPIALVSLVDAHRQWFKARRGLDVSQTGRDVSFCGHAILTPDDVFEVGDAGADPRFAGNPLVTGEPGIRFYAGAPLLSQDGHALGTVCVIDRKPRRLDERQRQALRALARQVVTVMEMRRALVTATRDSLTDPLTGAGNARAFDAGLRRHWQRQAGSGTPLSVLAIGVDDLPSFEATFGRWATEELLKQVYRTARAALPMAQPLARWEGDSFVAVLPHTDGPSAARQAEALRAAVAAIRDWGVPVHASVGIATAVPVPHGDARVAVHHAGAALQAARLRGGHAVEHAILPPLPSGTG